MSPTIAPQSDIFPLASVLSLGSANLCMLPGLATQLALAYAIHKTFIFVRIPLTIAVTPRIVRQLRAWGWNIGKKIVRRGPK